VDVDVDVEGCNEVIAKVEEDVDVDVDVEIVGD